MEKQYLNRLNDIIKLLHALDKLEIDHNNTKLLKLLFSTLPFLSNREYSVLLKCQLHEVTKYRKLYGNPGKAISSHRRRGPKRGYYLSAHTNWNSYDWLYKMRRYGINNLSKLIGVSNNKIIGCYRRHNIKLSNPDNKHPCDNYEWLGYHRSHNFTIQTCADIAGVHRRTISLWLFKYGIK